MIFNIAATALLFLGLAQAAPAPTLVEARAGECPPLAPWRVSSDPANAYFNLCTAYDVSWENACNRGTGPDPDIGIVYRPCTDAVWWTE